MPLSLEVILRRRLPVAWPLPPLLDHALALCPVPQVRLTSTTRPTVLRPSKSWSILKIREVLNKESFFLLRATKQQAQFECTSDISEK